MTDESTEHAIEEVADTGFNFDGQFIPVTPIKVGQIPRVLALVNPILAEINEAKTQNDWMTIAGMHACDLASAAAILTGVDEEKLLELELDEFLMIVMAVAEVNTDFFIQRLAPKMTAAVSQITGRIGTTQSSD